MYTVDDVKKYIWKTGPRLPATCSTARVVDREIVIDKRIEHQQKNEVHKVKNATKMYTEIELSYSKKNKKTVYPFESCKLPISWRLSADWKQ